MTRSDVIKVISQLYPADSEYESTRTVGQQLLMQARAMQPIDWRHEPTPVLIKYAELCILKEAESR